MPKRSRASRPVWKPREWGLVLLLLVVCGSIVTLAGTGQLQLYIHPRYTVFASAMAGIGVVVGMLAVILRFGRNAASTGEDGHEHDHDHEHQTDSGARTWLAAAGRTIGILTCVVVAAGMLVVPPATLSTRTTVDGLAGGGSATGKSSMAVEPGAVASLNTHELGSLIRHTTDVRSLVGEPVVVTGFVTADANDNNILFVTRFVIACCAVDAQPVGVPVRAPGWQAGAQWEPLADGDWVTVQGTLVANPGGSSLTALVVSPTAIEMIEEPQEPYEYE
ncbi:TIGR03943 family putative permease subunit [Lysinibacter cavernae]|uniref:Putative repeat protein (TIGR03943 family) n=1 Tax=Lysinibacter cavernae TaxID=1640652 RepID=A0A7X5R0B8_9MICO|nr:TIGR03943 family protein [Lysinibacter cavernae]NIH53298.1 putative repeat protein (TIGR03943 family) [Lysinibacter cavernae]